MALIALAFITFIAYSPALRGGFLFDDDLVLTDYHLIQAPDGLRRLWFTTEPTDFWPLTSTTFWIEWRLWGNHPTGYHIINLVLHFVSACLLWSILRRLRIPGAYLAALLFAIHPVNVQSVAWITQRKNTLAMAFFLASILFFILSEDFRPIRSPRSNTCYAFSLLAFLLAMLSKGSVAILPLILVGLICWRRRPTLADMLRLAPFLAIAIILTAVNIWFQHHGAETEIRHLSVAQRVLGAGTVVWFYLMKAFLPIRLSPIYPLWHIEPSKWQWWIGPVGAVAVTTALILYRKRGTRFLLYAWAGFIICLIPVMGLTDVGYMVYSMVADHYQYLAIPAIVTLAAAAWGYWYSHSPTNQYATMFVAVAVVATLATLTWRYAHSFATAEAFYRVTLQRDPNSWVARNNLGKLLVDQGRFPEAIPVLKEGIRLKNNDFQSYTNLGNAFLNTGNAQDAIINYERALKLRVDPVTEYDLALALERTSRPADAAAHLIRACQLRPDFAQATSELGTLSYRYGQFPQAVAAFEHLVELRPDAPDARMFLALAYSKVNRKSDAFATAKMGLQLAQSQGNTGLADKIQKWQAAQPAK